VGRGADYYSVMRILVCLVMAAGLLAGRQAKASDQEMRSCDVQPRTLDARATEEAGWMKTSPHGAKRVGKYELQVRWAKGVQVFKDKPPYGEKLGSSWYAYCGFFVWAGQGLHLIVMTDGDTFTGEMMDDATGKILPAGKTVWTSFSGEYYAATERPDGLNGENAMLFTREGKLLWKGYSGVLAADGTVVARFDRTPQNLVVGMMQDGQGYLFGVDDTPGQLKQKFLLTPQADGKWAWVVAPAKPQVRKVRPPLVVSLPPGK